MKILPLVESPELLPRVKELWRANSATLGFFPDGAFQDYANRGQIIVATDESRGVLGFLTYRLASRRATIVHLCVKRNFRRKGLAKSLIDELRQGLDENCIGVLAKCRRDYDANKMWPKLGFACIDEETGRSKKGALLNLWWQDLRRRTLFTDIERQRSETTITVVIDAQIFIDLEDATQPRADEAKSLVADWLSGEVTVFLTDEIFNELDRVSDEARRYQLKRNVDNYLRIKDEPDSFESECARLLEILGTPSSVQDWSDLRHLAHAIAGEVDIFATRDGRLLKKSDDIYERSGLLVLHPREVIIRLDEIENEAKYRPVRLAGTSFSRTPFRARDISDISGALLLTGSGERRRDLERRLRQYITPERRFDSSIVRNSNGNVIATIIIENLDSKHGDIAFLRAQPGKLSETLTRHLVEQAVLFSAKAGHSFLSFSDVTDPRTVNALADSGFFKLRETWAKLNYLKCTAASSFHSWLEELDIPLAHGHLHALREVLSEGLPGAWSDLERLIWPGKILDADISNLIIPINPQWAQHLFDSRLASQDLFGAHEILALNTENVYYRSARPKLPNRPARILWYVTKGKRQYSGSMSIRACSRLEEVVIGTPRNLYRKFRRLGVYQWHNLKDVVKGDLNKEMMAIRFSRTEQLRQPITRERIRSVLGGNPLRSPVQISSASFDELYKESLGTEA